MIHCIFFASKTVCVQDVQICKAALAELIKTYTDVAIFWYLDEEKVSVGGGTQKSRAEHQNSFHDTMKNAHWVLFTSVVLLGGGAEH